MRWLTQLDFEGLNYLISYPKGFSEDKKYPLVIFLHGAGERGTDIEHVNRWALPRLITEGMKIPAIALCPQCPQEYVWDNLVREIKGLTDMIAEKYKIKNNLKRVEIIKKV